MHYGAALTDPATCTASSGLKAAAVAPAYEYAISNGPGGVHHLGAIGDHQAGYLRRDPFPAQADCGPIAGSASISPQTTNTTISISRTTPVIADTRTRHPPFELAWLPHHSARGVNAGPRMS